MSKKLSHPDGELFDYLSGSLDNEASRLVVEHLAKCADCATVARLIRSLKEEAGTLLGDAGLGDAPDAELRNAKAGTLEAQTQNSKLKTPSSELRTQNLKLKTDTSNVHPDTSELATFYYAKSRPRRDVAAHVAACRACAAEIGEYARAEKLAALQDADKTAMGEMPAAAWNLIREWEESSFAMPKPASEVISHEMLDKLSRLVVEGETRLREMARNVSSATTTAGRELVPVIVVDRKGELRGVEMFEKTLGPRGASILKHAEESSRFHNKPVHALLDFGEGNRLVVSDLIRNDTARIESARPRARLRRADYFIIED